MRMSNVDVRRKRESVRKKSVLLTRTFTFCIKNATITSKQRLLRDELDRLPIKKQIKQNSSTASGSDSKATQKPDYFDLSRVCDSPSLVHGKSSGGFAPC